MRTSQDSAARVVDCHNDLLFELAFRSHRRGDANPFAVHWLPKLQAGGVALQVCPVFVDLPSLPEGALREALAQIAEFHRAVRENGRSVAAVRWRDDLAGVENGERLGLMLSMEGAEPLGYDPSLVEVMWELGVRMLSLTWNRRNPFADGAAETGSGGLSTLGRRLVDICVELGVILDLAHAAEHTYLEVLDRAGDAAVVVSHAACRAIHDHPRNLTDDAMRALAARGGVLGIMLHPLAVDSLEPTLDRVVDHIDHAVEVMGIEHVGLGSDFTRQLVRAINWVEPPDALVPPGMRTDAAIDDLEGPDDFANLVRALERRGYEGERLRAVLGENFLRVFRSALPAA
ncbi:MAG: dipeptidase [Gaiellaceae bacterium]